MFPGRKGAVHEIAYNNYIQGNTKWLLRIKCTLCFARTHSSYQATLSFCEHSPLDSFPKSNSEAPRQEESKEKLDLSAI
jgi:hypothetical protein